MHTNFQFRIKYLWSLSARQVRNYISYLQTKKRRLRQRGNLPGMLLLVNSSQNEHVGPVSNCRKRPVTHLSHLTWFKSQFCCSMAAWSGAATELLWDSPAPGAAMSIRQADVKCNEPRTMARPPSQVCLLASPPFTGCPPHLWHYPVGAGTPNKTQATLI